MIVKDLKAELSESAQNKLEAVVAEAVEKEAEKRSEKGCQKAHCQIYCDRSCFGRRLYRCRQFG